MLHDNYTHSNALLLNSKIQATSVTSREIIIPDQSGLAFFGKNGSINLFMYCMYVCMCGLYVCTVCMYVCMYVCTVCMCCMCALYVCAVCMYCLYVCIYCSMYVLLICMYVCMYVPIVCTFLYMHVLLFVCMYVCMHACLYGHYCVFSIMYFYDRSFVGIEHGHL